MAAFLPQKSPPRSGSFLSGGLYGNEIEDCQLLFASWTSYGLIGELMNLVDSSYLVFPLYSFATP